MEKRIEDLLEKTFLTEEELAALEECSSIIVEDCGCSGTYYGYHWYSVVSLDDTDYSYDVYIKGGE